MNESWRHGEAAHTEYRVVCDNEAHFDHAWEFRSFEEAERLTIILDDDPTRTGTCIPYRIEARFIDEWQPADV